MKRILTNLLILLIAIFIPQIVKAQCAPPSVAQITPFPAACSGQGMIVINSISGTQPGDVFQYQLQYDSSGNSSVVKPWQSADTFKQVPTGQYKVYIREVCASGFSSEYISQSVVVGSTSTPLAIAEANALTKSSCGNGALRVKAMGGGAGTYQYALMASLNEPANGTFLTPLQNDSVFDNLAPGTYYVRVYDACNSYATATVSIASGTDTANLTANRPSFTFYACDSLRFRYSIAVSTKYPVTPGSPFAYTDSTERFWVTYNGVTDTIPNSSVSFIYSSPSGIATAGISKTFNNITYPATITYGYKSACGTVFEKNTTITPDLKIVLLASSASCSTTQYTVRTTDSLSGNVYNYVNTKMSLDLGTSWSALNTTSTYSQIFNVGQTYNIWVASDCDTAKVTVTTVAPVLNFTLNEFNAFACSGNSGIYFNFPANSFSGNSDSIKFHVLNQPAAEPLPDSFFFYQMKTSSTATSGYKLTYDLPPGTYRFAAKDQCGSTDTTAITITPTFLSYTIAEKPNCLPTQAGFTVNAVQSNYNPYAAFSSLRAIVTNLNTGQVDSFLSVNQMRPTSINVVGIDTGLYEIKVITVRPTILPYSSCPILDTYYNISNQPLSLVQSTFTSACEDGAATIVAKAVGGGGAYSFTLSAQNPDGSWTDVAGPQTSNVFNGLLPNNVYKIHASDTCGSGTDYTTSFSNDSMTFKFSSSYSPCPGDSFTLSVQNIPSATYQWFKNSSVEANTSTTYIINPVTTGVVDTYQAKVNLGSCALYTRTFILDPAECGEPLPITLISFKGHLNEEGMAELQWEIANPEEARQYDIEYSDDSKKYSLAKSLLANGSNKSTFTDTHRGLSRIFYRLKLISADGSISYSPVLSLFNGLAGDERTVRIYPVVIRDYFNIEYKTSQDEKLKWSLYDMQGRIAANGYVIAGKGMSIHTIQNTDLANGSYILRLDNEKGYKKAVKVIVTK